MLASDLDALSNIWPLSAEEPSDNETTNNSHECIASEPPWEVLLVHKIGYMYVCPIIGAFGVIGSALSLVVMNSRPMSTHVRQLDKFAFRLLRSLALTDLLICVSALPAAGLVKSGAPELGSSHIGGLLLYERFSPFVISSLIFVATWLITLLSLDRYYAVRCGFGKRRSCCCVCTLFAAWCFPSSQRAQHISIAFVALLAALVNVPLLLQSEIVPFESPCQLTPVYIVIEKPVSVFDRLHLAVWALLGNVIPLATLVFTSLSIVTKIQAVTRITTADRLQLERLQRLLCAANQCDVQTYRQQLPADENPTSSKCESPVISVRCQSSNDWSTQTHVSARSNLFRQIRRLLINFERRRLVKSKVTAMLAWTVIAFFLLVAPHNLIKLITRFTADTSNSIESDVVDATDARLPTDVNNSVADMTTANNYFATYLWETLANVTQLLHSALNVIIYYCSNSTFRRTCVVLLRRLHHRQTNTDYTSRLKAAVQPVLVYRPNEDNNLEIDAGSRSLSTSKCVEIVRNYFETAPREQRSSCDDNVFVVLNVGRTPAQQLTHSRVVLVKIDRRQQCLRQFVQPNKLPSGGGVPLSDSGSMTNLALAENANQCLQRCNARATAAPVDAAERPKQAQLANQKDFQRRTTAVFEHCQCTEGLLMSSAI